MESCRPELTVESPLVPLSPTSLRLWGLLSGGRCLPRVHLFLSVLCIIWQCFVIIPAWAAQSPFQTDPEYRIDSWESEDGLPENSGTCMAQTPDGYLWFGTFNGLVRFDGVKFTV